MNISLCICGDRLLIATLSLTLFYLLQENYKLRLENVSLLSFLMVEFECNIKNRLLPDLPGTIYQEVLVLLVPVVELAVVLCFLVCYSTVSSRNIC